MYFMCDTCQESFSRKQYLTRHVLERHQGVSVKHYDQNYVHSTNATLSEITINGITRIIVNSAFSDYMREIIFYHKETDDCKGILPCVFFEMATQLILTTLEILKKEPFSHKMCSTVCVRFINIKKPDLKPDNSYFSVETQALETYDLNNVINTLMNKMETYQNKGSNWIIHSANFFRLKAVRIK